MRINYRNSNASAGYHLLDITITGQGMQGGHRHLQALRLTLQSRAQSYMGCRHCATLASSALTRSGGCAGRGKRVCTACRDEVSASEARSAPSYADGFSAEVSTPRVPRAFMPHDVQMSRTTLPPATRPLLRFPAAVFCIVLVCVCWLLDSAGLLWIIGRVRVTLERLCSWHTQIEADSFCSHA